MGTLTSGLGSASGAAASSMQWGLAGTALSAVGDLSQGIGQSQLYGYQAQVAANNAAIERQNSSSALAAGSYSESVSKMQTSERISSQKAAQGANGVDVNVGSPVAVRDSTATVGSLDAAMIHFNAARQSAGLANEAASYEAQASADRYASSNAIDSGITKAATSLISGATSVASKYSQYKLSGAVA